MESVIAIQSNNDSDLLKKLQTFQSLLSQEPKPESLDKTPDGKAQTVTISHVEMTLDELFFGQWSTENFKWAQIGNEVQGSLELVAINPISGREIRRTGAASIIIQVDKVPDGIKDSPQEKNRWALDPSNKKSNALDLGFPKLKAECLKNAAQSFGKVFGRDINRKKVDAYQPIIKGEILPKLPEAQMTKLLAGAKNGGRADVEKILDLNFDLTQKELLKAALNG